MSSTIDRVKSLPEYQALSKARSTIIWPLLILTIGVYMAFILTIAFIPKSLGAPIGDGVTSIGIVVGFLLILFNFAITLFYVRVANKRIQPLIDGLRQHAEEK